MHGGGYRDGHLEVLFLLVLQRYTAIKLHASLVGPLLQYKHYDVQYVLFTNNFFCLLTACVCALQILKDHPNESMSEIYGMEHLLRLFGELWALSLDCKAWFTIHVTCRSVGVPRAIHIGIDLSSIQRGTYVAACRINDLRLL